MKASQWKKPFLDEQQKKLLAEKARLEAELGVRGEAPKEDPTNYAANYQEYGDDQESNAAEYAATETDMSVVSELEKELGRVVRALERITNGTYGINTATGKPINQKRLEALPAAETDIIDA